MFRLCLTVWCVCMVWADKRTPQELQEFRDRVTKERQEAMALLKMHKQLKEEGRTVEANKIMESIVARKSRMNQDLAGEGGLGETYLKYKQQVERKRHPFASASASEKSPLEWETARNAQMQEAVEKACAVMRQQAAELPAAAEWTAKIDEYQRLQIKLLEDQLEVSRGLDAGRNIKDPEEKRAFLTLQKQKRIERRPQEQIAYQRADALHKELAAQFKGIDGDGVERLTPDL